jgi:hypothetical protein
MIDKAERNFMDIGTKEKFAFAIIYTGAADRPPSTLPGTLRTQSALFVQ